MVSRNLSSDSEILEEDFNDSMRVEWAKVQARAARWHEELLIIQEEIRRVLAFFSWKSSWWVEQAARRVVDNDPALVDGIRAYALKQAAIQTRMAKRCASHWLPVLLKHGITPSWKSDFTDIVPQAQQPQAQQPHPVQDQQYEVEEEEEDDDTDVESGNESELEDEEDIVANFAFEDY